MRRLEEEAPAPVHGHPGPAAEARVGRGAQMHQVTGPRPAHSPDRERAEMADRGAPAGPQVGRAEARRGVESGDGRVVALFRTTVQQVRRHEHLGQHPHQVTAAACPPQRPPRHHLLSQRTGHQAAAPLHQFPKHRIHAPTLTPPPRLPQHPEPSPVQNHPPVDSPHHPLAFCYGSLDRWRLGCRFVGVSPHLSVSDRDVHQHRDGARRAAAVCRRVGLLAWDGGGPA